MYNTLKLVGKLGLPLIKDKGFMVVSSVQRRNFSTCLPKMTDNKENRIVWVDLEVGSH